jgi:hypothetical protein
VFLYFAIGPKISSQGENGMNRLRVFAFAFLIVCTASFVWAQAEPREENKAPQEQPEATAPKAERQEAAKPQDESRPSKEEKGKEKQEPNKARQDESRPASGQSGQKEEASPADNRREERGRQASTENGGHARPAGRSAHIPDDKFKQTFGREHHFTATRVVHETTIVPNQTQFIYGGYTFVFVDPWPTEWAYTDDCYIDYVDGDYFLFDAMHPGIRIALLVIG